MVLVLALVPRNRFRNILDGQPAVIFRMQNIAGSGGFSADRYFHKSPLGMDTESADRRHHADRPGPEGELRHQTVAYFGTMAGQSGIGPAAP